MISTFSNIRTDYGRETKEIDSLEEESEIW